MKSSLSNSFGYLEFTKDLLLSFLNTFIPQWTSFCLQWLRSRIVVGFCLFAWGLEGRDVPSLNFISLVFVQLLHSAGHELLLFVGFASGFFLNPHSLGSSGFQLLVFSRKVQDSTFFRADRRIPVVLRADCFTVISLWGFLLVSAFSNLIFQLPCVRLQRLDGDGNSTGLGTIVQSPSMDTNSILKNWSSDSNRQTGAF